MLKGCGRGHLSFNPTFTPSADPYIPHKQAMLPYFAEGRVVQITIHILQHQINLFVIITWTHIDNSNTTGTIFRDYSACFEAVLCPLIVTYHIFM